MNYWMEKHNDKLKSTKIFISSGTWTADLSDNNNYCYFKLNDMPTDLDPSYVTSVKITLTCK